jgi:hypothetical protein
VEGEGARAPGSVARLVADRRETARAVVAEAVAVQASVMGCPQRAASLV